MATAVDTAIALVSLAEAKEYLKITTTGDDVIISHLINAVSEWVGRYLNRDLVSKSRIEYYSGDGSSVLILKHSPVTAIASIYADSQREWASSTLINQTDLIIKKDSGIIEAFNLFGNFQSGRSGIKITYTAGYTVATDGGATGTMPYAIRMAVKRLIDNQYRIGYTNRKLDYSSESLGGMNVTLKDNDIPKDVKSMLQSFKKIMPSPQFEYAD